MDALTSENSKTTYDQEASDNTLAKFKDMLETAEASNLHPFCMQDIIHRAEKKLAA